MRRTFSFLDLGTGVDEELGRRVLIFHLCQWFETVTCPHYMLITSTRNIELLELNSATAEAISLQRG